MGWGSHRGKKEVKLRRETVVKVDIRSKMSKKDPGGETGDERGY